MGKFYSEKSDNNFFSVIIVMLIWITYSVIYVLLKESKGTEIFAGYLTAVSEVCLDIILVIVTFLLWKNISIERKGIFAFFYISFIFAAISDSAFNVIANIHDIVSFTNIENTIIYLPWAGFLLFQLLAWVAIVLKERGTQKNRPTLVIYLPIFIIISVIFIAFYAGSFTWKVEVLSLQGSYTIINAILQLLSFVFVILCLGMTLRNQIRFLAVGYLIVISGAFIIQFNTVMNVLEPRTFVDSMWVLGQLLMLLGFYNIFKGQSELKKKYG